MNERILKLSKEAGSVADATYAKGPDAIWLREYNKKFAELIVRECADIANKQFEAATGLNDRDCLTAAEMKKRFGVK